MNIIEGFFPDKKNDKNPKITSSTHWLFRYPNKQETMEITYLDISGNIVEG